MIKSLFLLVLILVMGEQLLEAKSKSGVRFLYVLENPKYYGIDSARSWFEITGLKDKAVQDKINDTLRKVFCATTNFKTYAPGNGAGHGVTPEMHTDYIFNNGNSYGNGWVRFTDSDSLLYLEEASSYYGSGMHLHTFSTAIAKGKIAWIQIEATRGIIRLGFSLVTGNTIPAEFYIPIDPSKRDSLTKILDGRIAAIPPDAGPHHACMSYDVLPYSDSVIITLPLLIEWFNTHGHPGDMLISRKYTRHCLNNADKPIDYVLPVFLRFDESIAFLKQDEWLKLQTIYL